MDRQPKKCRQLSSCCTRETSPRPTSHIPFLSIGLKSCQDNRNWVRCYEGNIHALHLSHFTPLRCPERRAMPKRRYERQEPTHEWAQIRPLLKDSAQIKYELIRPVILCGVNVKERAAETAEPRTTIYYQANLFDQAGMASLLPPEPPPPVPQLDKPTPPPPMPPSNVEVPP